jgi:acyl-[acyl-carrier-protein]-phospholipid O-acyltransferase/long-chain-fatty-acid--[acyl-carrier-protein] ligase
MADTSRAPTRETRIDLRLLKARRFLPLFVTQSLSLFNDNLFKNAMVVLVTFSLTRDQTSAQVIVTLAAGLYILPFFLFSAMAGQVADKYEKQRVIRIVKLAEILLTLVGAIALFGGRIEPLVVLLFLIGTHSTFMGPAKYGILPVHLTPSELLAGNGLIAAAGFVSLLLGTIAGAALILLRHGVLIVSLLGMISAIVGLGAALLIPWSAAAAPRLTISFNIVADTWGMIHYAIARRRVRLPILGVAWFFLLGIVFVSQFPAFVKNDLGGDGDVLTLLLAVNTIGIAIGSVSCSQLLKGQVSARFVPLALLVKSIFVLDLYLATRHIVAGGALDDIPQFLAHPLDWRVLIDLTVLSIAGGFFVVPLRALMQKHSHAAHRARVIAASNIIKAFFMVVGSIATILLIRLGFRVPQIFLIFGALNFLVCLYTCYLMPMETIGRLAFLVSSAGSRRKPGID